MPLAVCPCGGKNAQARTSAVRVVGLALFPEDDAGNFDDALGFSGAGTFAEITSGADVTAGTGSTAQISTAHAITVSATSHNTATSTSDAASGGLLGSFSVNLPKALDNGGTLAEFDGDVNDASSLTVQATSTNTATASANIFSLGGIVIVSYPFILTPGAPLPIAPGTNGAGPVEINVFNLQAFVHTSSNAQGVDDELRAERRASSAEIDDAAYSLVGAHAFRELPHAR